MRFLPDQNRAGLEFRCKRDKTQPFIMTVQIECKHTAPTVKGKESQIVKQVAGGRNLQFFGGRTS